MNNFLLSTASQQEIQVRILILVIDWQTLIEPLMWTESGLKNSRDGGNYQPVENESRILPEFRKRSATIYHAMAHVTNSRSEGLSSLGISFTVENSLISLTFLDNDRRGWESWGGEALWILFPTLDEWSRLSLLLHQVTAKAGGVRTGFGHSHKLEARGAIKIFMGIILRRVLIKFRFWEENETSSIIQFKSL